MCVCVFQTIKSTLLANGAPSVRVEDPEQRLWNEGLCVRGPLPFPHHGPRLPLPAPLLRRRQDA